MQLTAEMKKMRESGMSYEKIASKMGVSKSTIQEAFGVRKRGRKQEPKAASLTLDALLGKYSPVERILRAIEALPDGEYKADDDMRELAGLTRSTWDRSKTCEKVKKSRVRVPDGSYVWGKAKDAAVLRRKLLEA